MSIIKTINGDCHNCESSFLVNYNEIMASKEYPEYCPFCGEPIDELSEESEDYIDGEDDLDEDEWTH